MNGRGVFIVFEGGEGSGKSTHARLLAERRSAVLTREPGGTQLGARLRGILLDPATVGLGDRCEALLMAADRADHVAKVIAPALAAGRDVVCDRFVGSSIAYQGYGRGLDLDAVWMLSEFATAGLAPDVVVHLAVDERTTKQRLATAGAPDRMEAAGDAFHRRVARGYAAQAEAAPGQWVTVDGTGAVDDVAERVRCAVERHLDLASVGR